MQVQCKECQGTGNKLTEWPTGTTLNTCPACKGRGHVSDKPQSLTHQHGGDHYTTMPIQPWEIIDSHRLNFYEGNAIKYILRRKPGQNRVLELQKAIHYLEHQIELEEAK